VDRQTEEGAADGLLSPCSGLVTGNVIPCILAKTDQSKGMGATACNGTMSNWPSAGDTAKHPTIAAGSSTNRRTVSYARN